MHFEKDGRKKMQKSAALFPQSQRDDFRANPEFKVPRISYSGLCLIRPAVEGGLPHDFAKEEI